MADSKILFVVGAGASKGVGLPTGKELTDIISDKVNIKFDDFGSRQISGDAGITQALYQHVKGPNGQRGNINPYLHACWRIADAMPQAMSVDSFIDDHRKDQKIELCGKLSIFRSILEAEKSSSLYIDHQQPNPTLDFKRLQLTWYDGLWQHLIKGSGKENIDQLFENVSFIIFNYDRCVEHFLVHAVSNYYGIEPAEAADLMRTLEIFHPYGVTGLLPWQTTKGSVPFGGDIGGVQLLGFSEHIKTFTERREDEAEISEMRQLVQDADTIVFLGFAFHTQNMELIKPAEPGGSKRVFATAYETSQNDRIVFESRINRLFYPVPQGYQLYPLVNSDCHGLFQEYGLSLSPM